MTAVRTRLAEAIWDSVHATFHEQRSCFNPDHEVAVDALEAIATDDALLNANEEVFSPHAARRMQEQARAALRRLRDEVPA